jgi:hypothetical protein
MFWATHCPSSGAQNCNCSLWFYIHFWLPATAMAQPLVDLALIKTRQTNFLQLEFIFAVNSVPPSINKLHVIKNKLKSVTNQDQAMNKL